MLATDTHELYNIPSATAVPTISENGSAGRMTQAKGWSVHRSVTVDISTDHTLASGGTIAEDMGMKNASLA